MKFRKIYTQKDLQKTVFNIKEKRKQGSHLNKKGKKENESK